MALVSDIEIRLRADIARLSQDLERARQQVSNSMTRITDMVKKAGAAFVGLAAGLSVAAFAGWIKGAIDATDAASDLAQRTGVAVEELAGLQLWFQIGGAEAGTFEASMIKLSKSIAEGGEEFKKIGVATRNADGSLRSNVQVLLDSGDAFAKLRDDTAKTALAVELFGKSGAVLIPILNSGSQGLREMTEMADKLGLTFNQKTVDAAGQFNDTLDFMGLALDGVARKAAAELLPTLNTLVGAMLKFITEGDGIKTAAETIGTGFKILYTAGVSVVTIFTTVGKIVAGSLATVTTSFMSAFKVLSGIVSGTMKAITTSLSSAVQIFTQLMAGDFKGAWASIQSAGKNTGEIIGATVSDALSEITNAGNTAASIVGSTFDDVVAGVTDAASNISGVWTGAGADTISALAGMNKGIAPITDAAAKEAAKLAEAYRDLIRALESRVQVTAREVAGLAPLNEAEKAHLDLTEQIIKKKLVLTKAEEARARSLINEAGANDVLIKSNKEWSDLQQTLADNARDLSQERMSLIDSARQEAEQNERLIETFGMTEAAIIRLTASRLLDQEAQRLGRTLTAEEIADLNRVIELKERSAKAVASRAELEASKAFWTDIEKTAHDTFVSIADGGKNAFQRLKETAKNTFFDWLYQQTIKKWIINIGTSTSGVDLSSLTGGSSNGSSSGISMDKIFTAFKSGGSLEKSIAESVQKGFEKAGLSGGEGTPGQAAQWAGKLGSTIGGYLAGSALNKGISGGYETGSGFMKAEKLATAVGSYINPVLGAAIGAISGVVNRAFGMKAKEFGPTTLNGSLGNGAFSGSLDTAWTQKGGWFRSDKAGTDKAAVDAMTASGLTSAYEVIKGASTAFAEVLGINADSIAKRTQSISIAMGKDEAANQKAIADFFAGVANSVATELLPDISKFQVAGEDAATTLQRLAVNYDALDQILMVMGSTSQKAFVAVGLASVEARERLIAFAGGLDALASQTTYFNENFLSQAEQIAIVQKPLNEALAGLGYAGITTADQFKTAVLGLSESGALATAEGAKTYAGLLALAPAFKTVSDYLKEVSDAAAQTAKDLAEVALAEKERAEAAVQAANEAAAAALEANEQMLRRLVDAALGAVQRAVQAQKDIVTKAYNDSMTVLQARISSVGESISKITELSTLLKNSLGTVSSDAQQGASRAAARAQITTALAIAKASGVLPSADSLKDALSTLNNDATDQFSSLVDYQREVSRTNAEIEALGGLTDRQLTEAQMQLRLLEETKALAERQYDAEMTRLDGILDWAQAEVDAINKVDNSVLSVVAAIATLKVATAGLNSGATPSNPTGGALSVEQLYKTVLGRDGEAAGLAYWKGVFGNVVDSTEYAEFIKGAQPELDMIDRQKRQMESVASMPGSGTMSSSSVTPEQAAFNQRMEIMQSESTAAIKRMSDQFNQVSGGGNSLLIENA